MVTRHHLGNNAIVVVVVIIVVMLKLVMVVICHGSLANSHQPYFHKVGLCHSNQSWKCCDDDDDYCDEDDDDHECDDVDIGVDLVNPASSRSQIGVHCRQARLK